MLLFEILNTGVVREHNVAIYCDYATFLTGLAIARSALHEERN